MIYKKVFLIGVFNKKKKKSLEDLDELECLSKTANYKVIKKFLQRLNLPNPKTFVGLGKIKEIKYYLYIYKVDTVIFDDELSSSQFKNINNILNCNIIDRTQLILHIFSKRAKTFYARKQVEMAKYKYLLPRLPHMWTHLEKQIGGIGLKGPGETEIETDRRIINKKIFNYKKKLSIIDRQIKIQSKNRNNLIRLTLIGYTNVGKSTLMNVLSKSNFFVENKLFATLDTTVRKVVINNFPFLLTDTVGFIRKLPTQLIESFKSTLDEIRESDILLHIIDRFYRNYKNQIYHVNNILSEIGIKNKPIIMIFNKIDNFPLSKRILWEKKNKKELVKNWKKINLETLLKNPSVVYISAKNNKNIEILKKIIYFYIKKLNEIKFPYKKII